MPTLVAVNDEDEAKVSAASAQQTQSSCSTAAAAAAPSSSSQPSKSVTPAADDPKVKKKRSQQLTLASFFGGGRSASVQSKTSTPAVKTTNQKTKSTVTATKSSAAKTPVNSKTAAVNSSSSSSNKTTSKSQSLNAKRKSELLQICVGRSKGVKLVNKFDKEEEEEPNTQDVSNEADNKSSAAKKSNDDSGGENLSLAKEEDRAVAPASLKKVARDLKSAAESKPDETTPNLKVDPRSQDATDSSTLKETAEKTKESVMITSSPTKKEAGSRDATTSDTAKDTASNAKDDDDDDNNNAKPAAAAKTTSTPAEETSRTDKKSVDIPEGARLEVQWQLQTGKKRWWGATVLPERRTCHDDENDDDAEIRVLDYDPYPQGGFAERSTEEVVFVDETTLRVGETLLDYRWEKATTAAAAAPVPRKDSKEEAALRAKYRTRGKELLERYHQLLAGEKVDIPVMAADGEVETIAAVFPLFAVSSLAALVESKKEPLSALATMATKELNHVYNTAKFTEAMTSAKIKLLATRKHLVKSAVAVLEERKISAKNALEDTSPLWRWEVTVLELLPDSSVADVKKARAARRKLASYLSAVARLLSSSHPEREEERVLKFEREEEKIRLVAESKRQKELEKEHAKLKKQQELKRRKEEAALEKQRKKEELALEKQHKKEQAALEKQQEKEVRKREREEAEASTRKKQQSLLAKQQNRLMSFFSASKKASSPAQKKAKVNENKPTRAAEKSVDFDSDSFRSLIGSGQCPKRPFVRLSKSARESRRPRTKKVELSVFVTVCPGNPFEAQPYSEQRTVRVLNKYKFLLFHEDVRPPYYGTWSKDYSVVKGKHPWNKDIENLDYDHDSECEWEEGDDEIGEDIENVADEDEEKDDDEGSMAEDGWLAADDEVDESMDEETRALRRKQLESEANEPREALTICTIAPNKGRPSAVSDSLADRFIDGFNLEEASALMTSHTVHVLRQSSVCMEAFPPALIEDTSGNSEDQGGKEMSVDEKKLFVKFVHNSTLGSKEKLIDEIRAAHPSVASSRAHALRVLDSLATKIKVPSGGACWQVKHDVLSELGLHDLAAENASETRQEEVMKVMAEAVHHGTYTSKDKAVDQLRSKSDKLQELSRAEALRLLETVATKKKLPTSGVYWEVKGDVREKLNLTELPLEFPSAPADQEDDDKRVASAKQISGKTSAKQLSTKSSGIPVASRKDTSHSNSTGKKRAADTSTASVKLLASFLKKKKTA